MKVQRNTLLRAFLAVLVVAAVAAPTAFGVRPALAGHARRGERPSGRRPDDRGRHRRRSGRLRLDRRRHRRGVRPGSVPNRSRRASRGGRGVAGIQP
jgi:hypothetical protein